VPSLSQLGRFAVLLVIAAALGEVAHLLRLPRLLGYVVAGIALGPYGSGLMHWTTISDLRILVDVAMGLFLFELGRSGEALFAPVGQLAPRLCFLYALSRDQRRQ
jgi:Kef-type K+ transport system membrane component KefB